MAQPLTYPNLQLELENIGALVQEEMIDRLFDQNAVVTGQLARSITPKALQVSGDEFVLPISLLQYGVYVDDGAERGPGGMPPVRDIASWIKQKRITVPPGFTPDQFAWAVARNIAKKGQRFKKPKPFIEVSLNSVVEQQIRNDNIGEAVALDIDENIQTNYGEI